MVNSCSAISCSNRFRKNRPDVHFFRFPLKRPNVLSKWVKAMRRKDWYPTASSTICSDHFLPKDFRHIVNGNTNKSILKLYAVPSKFNFPRSTSKKLNQQRVFKQNILQMKIEPIHMQKEPININTSASLVEVKNDVPKLLLFPVTMITPTLNENQLCQNPINGILCYESSKFQISKKTDNKNTHMNKISECSSNFDVSPSSSYNYPPLTSEDNLKQDLKIMTILYERALKKLKVCQEQCKRHVKRIISLEEVIDNLKQINSVTDCS